jgi:hypothetical protein
MRLNLSLKIETDPSEPEYIVTVPGAGYKFNSNSFFLLKVVPLFILYIIFTDFNIIFTNPPLMMSCGCLH